MFSCRNTLIYMHTYACTAIRYRKIEVKFRGIHTGIFMNANICAHMHT